MPKNSGNSGENNEGPKPTAEEMSSDEQMDRDSIAAGSADVQADATEQYRIDVQVEAPAAIQRSAPRAASASAQAERPGLAKAGAEQQAERDAALNPAPTSATGADCMQLARTLGIRALSDAQRRAVQTCLESQSCFLNFSVAEQARECVALAALQLPSPTLVLSPYAGLRHDLVDRLRQRRVPVVCLDNEVSGRERKDALERISLGGPLLVLSAPEITPDLEHALGRGGVSLVAVESSHLLSAQAAEFRPTYQFLGGQLARLGTPRLVLTSAVATSAIRLHVLRAFNLGAGRQPAELVDAEFVRSNVVLAAATLSTELRAATLLQLAQQLPRPGIIYCATPAEVDRVYAALGLARIPAHRFHRGMSASERAAEHLQFLMPGRRAVMVATSAFGPSALSSAVELGAASSAAPSDYGLGINKADLRFCIHAEAPASLEQYVEDIGSIGRDGAAAYALLLSNPENDRQLNQLQLQQARLTPEALRQLAGTLSKTGAGSARPLDTLALASGLSRQLTTNLVALLAEARLVTEEAGRLRLRVTLSEFAEGSERLAEQLAELRRGDSARLGALASYVSEKSCRTRALARYFGFEGAAACGHCDACGDQQLERAVKAGQNQQPTTHAPRRRDAAQRFEVTPHGHDAGEPTVTPLRREHVGAE